MADFFDKLGFTPTAQVAKPAAKERPDEEFADLGFVQAKSPEDTKEVKSGGLFKTEFVEDDELKEIAGKHKTINWKDLKDFVSWYGGVSKELEDASAAGMAKDVGKAFLGKVGKSFGLGLPQKIHRMMQDNPEMESALDDLNELIRKKSSYAEEAVNIIAGIGGAAGLAKGAAKAAPKLAAAYAAAAAPVGGAAALLGESRAGEEVEQAALGAALGAGAAAVPWVARGVASSVRKAMGKTKAAAETAELIVKDLDEVAEEALTRRKDEVDIAKRVLKETDVKDFPSFKETTPEELVNKLITLKDVRKVLNKPYSPEMQMLKAELREQSIDPTNRNLAEYIAYKRARSTVDKFERDMARPVSQLLDEQGEEYVDRAFDGYILQEEAIKEAGRRQLATRLPAWSAARRLASIFSDAKPLSRSIDDKLKLSGKLSLENTLDDLSRKHNLYTVLLGDKLKGITALRRETRKAGVSEEDLYRALDTGKAGDIPDDLISKWRGFFDGVREEARELGIPIEKRENYVPHRRLSPVKYARAMEKRIQELQKTLPEGASIKQLTEDQFTTLQEQPKFKELVSELEFLKGEIKDVSDYNFKIQDSLLNRGANRAKLATDAFASKAREGSIPDFVRDTQTGNLASKWVQSTFRHAALRDGLQNLQRIAKVADAAGDEFTAKYVKNLAADVVGSRSDSIAAQTKELGDKFLTYAQRKAEESTNPIIKRLYSGTGYIPGLLNTMARQVYPNYLGLNPKSVLQNLAQPLLTNVPDIGYGLGSRAWGNAQLDLMSALKNGMEITLSPEVASQLGRKAGDTINTRSLNLIMQNSGLLPKQWTGEMVDALQEGFRSSAVVDLSKEALDKYTNAMMALFEKSEIYARATSYFMGRRLGKELAQKPKLAMQFARDLGSPAYAKRIQKAAQMGDSEMMERTMVDYLNSTNMFNYDRMNMSEYGRYMGPLFSVFSKWPTSIAGRAMQSVLDQGLAKGMRKNLQFLLAPFLALQLVDFVTSPEQSATYDKLIGRGGLSSWTPFDSLAPVLEGGLLESPALATGKGLAQAMGQDRPEKALYSWANSLLSTFGIGSGLLRFLGDDISIYRTDEKPKGPSIERQLKSIENQLQNL